jgi:hypothetical protein
MLWSLRAINPHAELQRRILARMRSFGMTPVLPAFAGFVPAALAAKHPELHIVRHAQASIKHPKQQAAWTQQYHCSGVQDLPSRPFKF